MKRPGTQAVQSGAGDTDRRPVQPLDSFRMITDRITLADGHPLRGSKCLLCGCVIGGRVARFVSLIVCDYASCTCGQVPTITQLVCGEHWPLEVEVVIEAAVALQSREHPIGPHSCTG